MPLTPILPLASVSPVEFAPEGQKPPPRFRDRVQERVGTQDLLIVRIGRERFAVPLEAVDEMVETPRVRAVPGAQPGLLGLFTLGDSTLPLYSPAAILGVEPVGEQAALVMRGGRARIALAVDDADDVIRIALADVIDAPRTGHHDDVVLGVVWREGELLTLLDARAVVTCYAALSTEGS
jgi:chemotaxis signal transduction protein